ncbi:LysR family transcriptional regulator [Anaerocolumna sedimenticola]|uniref:LysR family transcriptional regulator n=1 Tax=Anaerocolumna sedimenticola TaxID=2696063 RepID=A0A6P1TTG4_9FIRM|nr:LysR family transcriptional regulator [Anaerocolumna sedimenticola]QHQ62788.1 LysR family transcriptional regulator [Anaerocolumna sedimenticola]
MEQNLSLYKIFNTVAETGNISHAAKELYISQPAISKAITKLEENLGILLFNRTSRGVHLTEEGNLLYEHTKSAFDTLLQGEANIKRINELGIGHLRIGVSTTLCKYILLPYLKRFVSSHPHIKITIECQSTFQTLELLERGKLDIGLIGKPVNLKNLDFYTVEQIEDIFVTTESYLENLRVRESTSSVSVQVKRSKDNKLSGISDDIFKTANVMLLDEKNMTRLYIEDYFTRNQIETNQILEVSNMDLLIEFAKIGLGVSCVIKEFIQKELEGGILIEIPLEKPLGKREVGFAYLSNSRLSEAAKRFIQFYKHQ